MASCSRRRILVVNPNSNQAVTSGLAAALVPVAFADGPDIECMTLKEGPFGIETQEHVDSVALLLRRLVAGSNGVDAFVIACYSDPGLHACREATPRPVFGINEAGVLTALARGERFGVIAKPASASSPSSAAGKPTRQANEHRHELQRSAHAIAHWLLRKWGCRPMPRASGHPSHSPPFEVSKRGSLRDTSLKRVRAAARSRSEQLARQHCCRQRH